MAWQVGLPVRFTLRLRKRQSSVLFAEAVIIGNPAGRVVFHFSTRLSIIHCFSLHLLPSPFMPTVAEQIAALVQRSFSRQGALMAWNARLQNLAPGSCEIVLPMSALVSQQHGYFHGGVIGAIADSAGGYAANTLLLPTSECLTAEYKINILSPGVGDALIARGTVLKTGRSLVVTRADVFAVRDGVEKLCAVMQQTLFVIPVKQL